MKIAVIGTGYVGLVQGVIMSGFGSEVICVDKSVEKIERLKKGELPIYEPGLLELLQKNQKAKRISFTTDIEKAIKDKYYIRMNPPTFSEFDKMKALQESTNAKLEASEEIMNAKNCKAMINKWKK